MAVSVLKQTLAEIHYGWLGIHVDTKYAGAGKNY
jgi:hypothetical protein